MYSKGYVDDSTGDSVLTNTAWASSLELEVLAVNKMLSCGKQKHVVGWGKLDRG